MDKIVKADASISSTNKAKTRMKIAKGGNMARVL